jgi:hypothetical protein
VKHIVSLKIKWCCLGLKPIFYVFKKVPQFFTILNLVIGYFFGQFQQFFQYLFSISSVIALKWSLLVVTFFNSVIAFLFFLFSQFQPFSQCFLTISFLIVLKWSLHVTAYSNSVFGFLIFNYLANFNHFLNISSQFHPQLHFFSFL